MILHERAGNRIFDWLISTQVDACSTEEQLKLTDLR